VRAFLNIRIPQAVWPGPRVIGMVRESTSPQGVQPLAYRFEFDQASYTLHFLTRREPPVAVCGFARASCSLVGDGVYASEWVMVGGSIPDAAEAMAGSEILMRHIRIYRPRSEQFCTVDASVLEAALGAGFIVQA
jgi:hypothetical protein